MSVLMLRRSAYESVAIQASGIVTATGNSGTGKKLPVLLGCLCWELDVTAAATVAGDTLDVSIQTNIDGNAGDNWVDIVHFTQVLGNGGAKRYFAKTITSQSETMFENGTALAAGSVRNLFGDQYRARWVVAGTGSFTFAVSACPQ